METLMSLSLNDLVIRFNEIANSVSFWQFIVVGLILVLMLHKFLTGGLYSHHSH
jgi:hypothetical protein